VVDTAGTVTYHAAYDSFGALTSQSGGGGDRFGFTAREHDAGTDLRQHRRRFADPETGRWTQEDPIGFAAGDTNLYRYQGNDPAAKIRLRGKRVDDPGSGGVEKIPPRDQALESPSYSEGGYDDVALFDGDDEELGGGSRRVPTTTTRQLTSSRVGIRLSTT